MSHLIWDKKKTAGSSIEEARTGRKSQRTTTTNKLPTTTAYNNYTARNIVLPLRSTNKRTGSSFLEAPTAWP